MVEGTGLLSRGRRKRERKKWSQSDLAREASVNVDALRVLEQGKRAHPSFFFVAALLDALGVSLDQAYRKLVRRSASSTQQT